MKDSFKHIGSDLPAGLVVFFVALPLCLGIALASGAPLFAGIIAGVVGSIVVGSLSGSQLGVSGPAAGLIVVVVAAIRDLGSFELFLMAVVLAGVVQLIAGFMKAGVIAYYFPSSVIKGMLAAIGLILIMKEIPHALGYDVDFMGDEDFAQADGHNTITELYYAVIYSSPGAIILSIISMALLILFDRPFIRKFKISTFIPGALIVVFVGVLVNHIFGLVAPHLAMSGKHLVQLPVANSLPEFLGFFQFPDVSGFSNPKLYLVALTLAVVASLESLLSVEATDKLDPQRRITDANRELKAQGMGNIVSGLIGGLPITQVIVRSSANINSGGKTKVAGIIHGIFLLIAAVLLPSIMNMIPLAALACVLLMVGYKLSKFSLYTEMYRLGWGQFVPFIVTVIAILFTDLLKGIGIGMAMSIYFILLRNYRFSYYRKSEKTKEGEVITLTLSEEVTFLNKGSIQNTLSNLPNGCTVVIDGSKSNSVDYDVLEAIQNFKVFTAPPRNIRVSTIGLAEVTASSGH
jgi:carbonic anhydrase